MPVPDMVDVAIVGSGMSGSAVGAELTRLGADYVVLEAGPDAGLAHVGAAATTARWSDPALDPWFRPFFDRLDATVYPATSGYRVRVGGRSLYWRGICFRIEPPAWAAWPAGIREPLLAAGGLYAQLEEELTRWTGRESLRAPRTSAELSWVARLTAAGFDATPTPRAIRLLPGDRWEAYSPARRVPRDRVRAGRPVTAIRPGRGDSFRLETGGGTRPVAARKVVLCAGVFGNLRLVTRLLHDAAAVRAGPAFRVTDHLACGILLSSAVAGEERMDSSVHAGFHAAECSNVVVESAPDGAGTMVDIWAMGEQPPESALEVSFPEGTERIAWDREGRARIRRRHEDQRTLLGTIAERLGLKVAGLDRPARYAAARALARRRPGQGICYQVDFGELDHESGGLALGGDRVDLAGRLRHVDGVFVAGPCLFPRAGAANPTLTTLALARHVARQVAES